MNIDHTYLPLIELLPASSSEGDALLKTVPGAASQELWRRLQPFSVVLLNNTDRTVIGYAVQWTFIMRDGSAHTQSYHYGQPDALLDNGKSKIPLGHRFYSKMVGPLSRQLVYPLAQISLPIQLTQPLSQESETQLEKLESLAQEASQMTFTMDAVLLEDGTMLGRDTTHFLEAYSAALEGEQEIIKYIVTSATTGVSRNEITEQVAARKDKAYRSLAGDEINAAEKVFNTALIAYAGEFLSVQSISGYEAAVSVAREHLYESPPKLSMHPSASH